MKKLFMVIGILFAFVFIMPTVQANSVLSPPDEIIQNIDVTNVVADVSVISYQQDLQYLNFMNVDVSSDKNIILYKGFISLENLNNYYSSDGYNKYLVTDVGKNNTFIFKWQFSKKNQLYNLSGHNSKFILPVKFIDKRLIFESNINSLYSWNTKYNLLCFR